MTLSSDPCPAPACGGPPVPAVPWLTTRKCPAGTAIIIGGVTAVHASPTEDEALALELNQRAAAERVPWEAGLLLDDEPGETEAA
jgi:hypothetical protein